MPDRYHIAHNKKGEVEQCKSCKSLVPTRPIKKNERYVADSSGDDVRLCAYCDIINLPQSGDVRKTVNPEIASAFNILEQRIVQQLSNTIRNRGRLK